MPIRDYIAEFLRTHCDLELDTIAPQASPADLGLDSLTVLSIIVLVEKNYGIALADRQVASARTFAELMELFGVSVAPVTPLS
ncbi:acyl carrier protein [Nocardia carnea]|uniref:acyl carrier protein n=1 Tax=Nocardia carnea TaxID=37328 RepID=UPI002456E701|nr:acyl carrier protein [Nocardia carnea]